MIIGPAFIGQDALAKYITAKNYGEVLDYQKFIDRKKKELAPPEEEELEEGREEVKVGGNHIVERRDVLLHHRHELRLGLAVEKSLW